MRRCAAVLTQLAAAGRQVLLPSAAGGAACHAASVGAGLLLRFWFRSVVPPPGAGRATQLADAPGDQCRRLQPFAERADSQLTSLSLKGSFTQPLAGTLPQSLTDVDIQPLHAWRAEALEDLLPSSLTSLRVRGLYRVRLQPATFACCPLLRSLDLGPLERSGVISVCAFPPSLTALTLSNADLVLKAGALPKSLLRLNLGDQHDGYTQPGLLPSGLQSLRFGQRQSKPLVAKELPASLTELECCGNHYNFSLDRVLSARSQLTRLVLSMKRFDQPFQPHSLPPSLTSLTLHFRRWMQVFERDVLPPSLLSLELNVPSGRPFAADSFVSCPRLRVLDIVSPRFRHEFSLGQLPASLHTLLLPDNYHRPLRALVWLPLLSQLSVPETSIDDFYGLTKKRRARLRQLLIKQPGMPEWPDVEAW